MLSGFIDFISKENLCTPTDRILLAVSGGMDSVVMARLFSKAAYDFGIAHCNFLLRGKESDEDELFVQQLAETYNVPFYSVQFPTEKYARENKMSVQMAARDLRYKWFNELCRDENYNFVATAHHLDDSIETFFINLLRGSGIKGLAGIFPRSGNIIRPLLFASRKEIENFINNEKITYREDSSNQDTKYLRNQIRHNILPLFENENPSFRENLASAMDHLNNALGIYKQLVKEKQASLISRKGQQAFIMLSDLETLDPIRTWTFELLQPFGFNYSTCCDIIESLKSQSGKSFFSDSHRIIKDREKLIISPRSTDETNAIYKIERSEKRRLSFPLDCRLKYLN